jgi:hypothetical protein
VAILVEGLELIDKLVDHIEEPARGQLDLWSIHLQAENDVEDFDVVFERIDTVIEAEEKKTKQHKKKAGVRRSKKQEAEGKSRGPDGEVRVQVSEKEFLVQEDKVLICKEKEEKLNSDNTAFSKEKQRSQTFRNDDSDFFSTGPCCLFEESFGQATEFPISAEGERDREEQSEGEWEREKRRNNEEKRNLQVLNIISIASFEFLGQVDQIRLDLLRNALT